LKHLIVIFLMTFLPQNIFAHDFKVSVDFENRAALLGKNKIPIAEKKKATDSGGMEVVNDLARLPLELNFSDSHYFKVGAAIQWHSFDLGAYYTTLSNTSEILSNHKNGKFKNTFPLSTGPDGFYPDPPNLPVIGKALLLYPNFRDTSKTTGTAVSQFAFNHFDLEAGTTVKIDKIAFRISIGARYAKYIQSLSVNRNNTWQCRMEDDDADTSTPEIRVCLDPDVAISLHPKRDPTTLNGHYPLRSNMRNFDMDITAFGPRLGLSVDAEFSENISLVGAFNWAVLFSERSIRDNYKSTEIAKKIKQDKPGKIATPGSPRIEPVYRDTGIFPLDHGGFIEKDTDRTVHNLELEIGLQYTLQLSDSSTLSFLAGYRHDIHYGVMTSCGSSKINDADPKDVRASTIPISYGNCGKRNVKDNSISHGAGNDFISHGPFLKTTFQF